MLTRLAGGQILQFNLRPRHVRILGERWCKKCQYLKKPASSRRTAIVVTLKEETSEPTILLYKFPWMRHLRFISRLKQLQVGCVVLLTIPISYWYQQDLIKEYNLLAGVTAATATTVMLVIFSYFFTRIVGELHYNPHTGQVQLATLTFWSQRRNQAFYRDDVIPLRETRSNVRKTWQRLEISGHSNVYLYSLRLGKIYNTELLGQLLDL